MNNETPKLVKNLDRLTDFAIESFTSEKCPICNRIIEDKDDIQFLKEYGYCLMCDNEKDEDYRGMYREVNEDNDGLPERRFY